MQLELIWLPKVQAKKISFATPRVVMGTTIKAWIGQKCRCSTGGLRGLRLKRGSKGEKQGRQQKAPVQLMPCIGAQNYLRLNDPIHSFDAPPPPIVDNTKTPLTSPQCKSASLLSAHHVVTNSDRRNMREKGRSWDTRLIWNTKHSLDKNPPQFYHCHMKLKTSL